MITIADIVYYTLYFICLLLSFTARKGNISGLVFLRLMLCAGFVNEMAVEILQLFHKGENTPHYFYIPVEYGLLIMFYLSNTDSQIMKTLMKASAVIYILAGIFTGIFYYHLQGYPSVIYNVSCFLNTVWLSYLFFNLKTLDGLSITQLPVFWVLTALILFYAGMFFFNAVYNYFIAKDKTTADALRLYINNYLNFMLYLLLSYAFIWSVKIKKYSYQP